jgi:RecA/RadA recombinase
LSAQKVRRLSLGISVLDDIFPGFEAGNFAVLHGDSASFISFLLCVRAQLPPEKGGFGSSVVFVDGGNSFSPYIVAELARSYGLDSRATLENIYISRAFTAYQLSSLVLEKLEPFLKSKKAKLLVVSEVSSLYFDMDIPKTEAKYLFIKTCAKLSDIATNKQTTIVATYFNDRRSKRGVFFEAVLLGRSNILIRLKRKGRILTFILEAHPYIKPFSIEFPTDYTTLTDFMGCKHTWEEPFHPTDKP